MTSVQAETKNYWWHGSLSERYWVEIRRGVAGLGYELRCPFTDSSGEPNPWYDLLDDLVVGQVIYHWNAGMGRFIGRSIVARSRAVDQQTGERLVSLRDFRPLRVDIGLPDLQKLRSQLETARDTLDAAHPSQRLYLPFQFRSDGLRLMSNYFTKLPASFQDLLFGPDGLGEAGLPEPPPEEGPAQPPPAAGVRAHYLRPFRPKADSAYVAQIESGLHRRGRVHETLVNNFARWLQARGFQVGRNAAIDLGVEDPPVIIEAKAVASWARSIREAVGQLYEYRFFQVVSPQSMLVFLASQPLPSDWLRYLEEDRGIGSAWRHGKSFLLSPLARSALQLE